MPKKCIYCHSNTSHTGINTRKTLPLLLEKERIMGKGPWNWMPTDSDSVLKRKRDDSGTIYVSNAENLDISHATVMSVTLPARKIIGIDAYHMDTQGRKPGNRRGLTPP